MAIPIRGGLMQVGLSDLDASANAVHMDAFMHWRGDARGDCYMPCLTATQKEHSTYAGHPAYSRYDCRQPWLKGVS